MLLSQSRAIVSDSPASGGSLCHCSRSQRSGVLDEPYSAVSADDRQANCARTRLEVGWVPHGHPRPPLGSTYGSRIASLEAGQCGLVFVHVECSNCRRVRRYACIGGALHVCIVGGGLVPHTDVGRVLLVYRVRKDVALCVSWSLFLYLTRPSLFNESKNPFLFLLHRLHCAHMLG